MVSVYGYITINNLLTAQDFENFLRLFHEKFDPTADESRILLGKADPAFNDLNKKIISKTLIANLLTERIANIEF